MQRNTFISCLAGVLNKNRNWHCHSWLELRDELGEQGLLQIQFHMAGCLRIGYGDVFIIKPRNMLRHSMIENHFKEFLNNCISHTSHVLLLFVLFRSTKHCLYLALFGLCIALLLFRISTYFPLFQIVIILAFYCVL